MAVIAVLPAACGSKPQAPPVEAVTPGPVDAKFVEVRQEISLETPRRPWGTQVRAAGHPLGDLYVVDTDHDLILRYGEDGRLLQQTGGTGEAALQFHRPVDIATDGLTLWVLDRQNRRLVRLSRELNFIEEISLSPPEDDITAPLWFDAVTCAANGDVFLLDTREPSAVRISPAGDVLASYGGFGMGAGRLEAPTDLAANSDGSLFVADGQKLLLFDRAGNLKSTLVHAEPLERVASDGQRAWVTTRSGRVAVQAGRTLARVVIDSEYGIPRPVDIALGRANAPALLDADQKVWLLSPGD